METASNNISDILAYMILRYNKARQAVITNEIIEVLNGAASMI